MEKILNVPVLGSFISDLKRDNIVQYTFPYYLIIFLYALLYISYSLGNAFILAWIVFGGVTFLDYYLKHDLQNPTKEEQRKMKKEFKYKIPIIITIALDWISLIWGVREIVYGDHGYLNKFGLLFAISVFQGSSINISHEINHKLSNWERILGTFNLAKNFYSHFLIEHNEGHHKMVATPTDPATSKFGQTLYEFYPQSINGGYISAWQIENRLCKEKYGTAFTPKNKMIYFTVSNLLIPASLWFLFNWRVMAIQLIIGVTSVFYLEAINYIEHYGLERKQLADGSFENVNIRHSWNAPHRFSNYILFKLQRHSDHHENALKPYQTLCSYDDSPLLPSGYAACLLLSFFPKFWFEIMNPLVEVYKKGEKPSAELLQRSEALMGKFVFGVNVVFLFLVTLTHFTSY